MINKEKLKKILKQEINKIENIRSKDGIVVSRIFCADNRTYIIKYFENTNYLREIEMYKVVNNLGIKTLDILCYGPNFLLMEDVDCSKEYRLATDEDLLDENVLKHLAEWYKKLHEKGKNLDLSNFYDENDIITKENIEKLKLVLDCESVSFILDNLANIKKLHKSLTTTLVYNDFSSENLIVGNDVAFLYDYNFLGRGYVYADIQNVLSALSDDKKQVFLKFYGENFSALEQFAYFILQPLACLCVALKKEEFPKWAISSVECIKSEKYRLNVQSILKMI